jgi:hypothetical protein
MERCLVCSQELARDSSRCPRCQWPIGFGSITRDPRTDADVVNWAAMMYKKLLKMHDQQQTATSNVQSEVPQADLSSLEARVQQLTTELHSFNGSYIQERHRHNRKIDELTQDVAFFKEIIQTNQESIEKIANLERQYQEISQQLVAQYSPPVSELIPLAVIRDEPQSPRLELVRSPPISLPVFEVISEQPVIPEIKSPISPAERDLLDFYNRSLDILENIHQETTSVSIDQDALHQNRGISQVTFVGSHTGDFLVVRQGEYQYLVPKKKRQINSHIHKTVKYAYICEGYHENYEQFILLRPALVEEIASNCWQLGQKGVLKFK